MTWQEYLEMIVEPAKTVCAGYDLPYQCVVAQGAIESQWGTYGIGNGGYNIFGRKFSTSSAQDGFTYVLMNTDEDDGAGNLYEIQAKFVSYPSMGDAVNDWCQLMVWGPYKQFSDQYHSDHDLEAFCRGIASIYATDIYYGDKIMNTIREIGSDM
jgi:flagellum-specific peptidoglycan hydrolase FlgJ